MVVVVVVVVVPPLIGGAKAPPPPRVVKSPSSKPHAQMKTQKPWSLPKAERQPYVRGGLRSAQQTSEAEPLGAAQRSPPAEGLRPAIFSVTFATAPVPSWNFPVSLLLRSNPSGQEDPQLPSAFAFAHSPVPAGNPPDAISKCLRRPLWTTTLWTGCPLNPQCPCKAL